MLHLGDVPASTTLYIPFHTFDSNGASITLTGLAATDIEIYKNGSVTQRASDNGYTLLDTDGIDFDGTTGIHGFSIDLSDNSDSGFFSVGGFYWVVVASVTVDTRTVNFIAATFRIVAAAHTAGYPVVTIKDGTGTGEIDTTSGGVLVAALAANAITATSIASDAIAATKIAAGAITNAKFAAGAIDATAIADGAIDAATFAANAITSTVLANDAITAAKLHADVTTELQSGLATSAALATVDGIVDDILLDTAEIGAAGAGLTAINLPNQTMDIVGNITGNLSGSVGSVTGAVGSVTGNVGGTINGLTATALKDFFDTDSATTYASAVAGSVVKEIADNAGGASLTVQDIVDGVWDEDASAHQDQGSFGQTIGDSVADTASIHAYASQNYVHLDTVVVPTVQAILTDTAEIGAAGAGLTVLATQASVNTIDDLLDTEIPALTTAVADLPTNAELATALGTADDAMLTQIALVKTQTDKLTFTVANQIDANIQYVNNVQVNGDGQPGTEWGP
jgi:hypothetical protein